MRVPRGPLLQPVRELGDCDLQLPGDALQRFHESPEVGEAQGERCMLVLEDVPPVQKDAPHCQERRFDGAAAAVCGGDITTNVVRQRREQYADIVAAVIETAGLEGQILDVQLGRERGGDDDASNGPGIRAAA